LSEIKFIKNEENGAIVEGRKIRFTKDCHDCTMFLNQEVRMGIVKMFFIIVDTKNSLRMIIEFNWIGKWCAVLLITGVVLV
jgi:hypothetical protein